MKPLPRAIYKTLAYADVFAYPLLAEEVWRFLISPSLVGFSQVQKELQSMAQRRKLIASQGGYYFLKGREKNVFLRKKRERLSQEKMKRAKRISRKLKLIPTIKMLALTGALAMKNAEEEDDLDFLVVAAKNRLWITRGIVVVFLSLLGLYRRPGKIKNQICPNMFLAEDCLALPPNEQDLFTAHEVCQAKPLWEKEGTYFKFLEQNQWVKRFLPNWKP
jgi:hypothetical protein